MKQEMKNIQEDYDIKEPIKWKLWSLDKSQRICTLKITITEAEDAITMERQLR